MLSSALTLPSQILYLREALFSERVRRYGLRGGGSIELRPGTTDRKVFDEVFIDRVYDGVLPPARSGVQTIVDLGANIGLSTIALLRMFPGARAVAVEPDPGNFGLLKQNLRSAGLAWRGAVLRGFAGAEEGFAELVDSGNGAWGMRMGARAWSGTPVWTLTGIARQAGMNRISLLKCDIEGAERDLFADIRGWENLVSYVVLELHADLFPVEQFEDALASSRYEWTIAGRISARSPLSVIGLRRGAPKARSLTAAAQPGASQGAARPASYHESLLTE